MKKLKRIVSWCLLIVPAMLMFLLWWTLQAVGIDDEAGGWWSHD